MNDPEHLRPPKPGQTVILVAEDEVLVRNIARIVLEAEGYFVLSASDGEEALTISRKYPGVIHAVLTDVRMPKMDGLELRGRVLDERPGIRVLLMSGQIESPTKDVPFLRKPFGPAVLKERIRQVLRSSASAEFP